MALSEGAPESASSWERLCLCSASSIRACEYRGQYEALPAEEGTPPQSTAEAERSRAELTATEARADAAEEHEATALIPRLIVAEEEAARATRERDSVTRERDALLEKVEELQAKLEAAQLAAPEQNAAEPDKQPKAAAPPPAPPAAPPPPPPAAPGPPPPRTPPAPTAAPAAAPAAAAALDVARISAVQLKKPPALAPAHTPDPAVRLASNFGHECDQFVTPFVCPCCDPGSIAVRRAEQGRHGVGRRRGARRARR